MMFHLEASFVGQVDLTPFTNALQNWKVAWDLRNSPGRWDHHTALGSSPRDLPVPVSVMWKRIGFMRHSREYWTLAGLALERIQLQNENSKNRDLTGESTYRVKVDDVSMQQLGELVNSLRNLQVQL